MNNELQKLEELKKAVSALISSKKKFIKLSEKRASMTHENSTPKAVGNAEANLNWHAMDHEKLIGNAHALAVDCGLAEPRSDYDEVILTTSPFHKYPHNPKKPECVKSGE